jgi:hypothetical protein
MGSTLILGQQELMEPTPTRRLDALGSTHWGVDPSTRHIAIACAETREVATAPFAPVSGAARLDEIYVQTRRLVSDLISRDWDIPGVIVVEQPGGSSINWPLYYGVGVIQAALWAEASRQAMGAVQVETMPPNSWKKIAVGRGDVYKPKVKGGRYGVLEWARHRGYEGSSWDEADALGIAEAARRTIALR